MKYLSKTSLLALAAAGVMAFSGHDARTAEFSLTASSSHPPVIPWVKTIQDHVVPESVKRAKELGHTITWTEAYAGALYDFQNTLEGVQEGLGDLAWVGTLWEPSKLPLHNVTFYAPFVTDSTKIANAIQDDMHANIPAMNEAWTKYNQVYLGPQSIDDYVLITNFPVKEVDDLKGKKIYGPGPVATWIRGAGAVGVNGGLPVYYNGIQTGVADGAIIPGSSIVAFKLHEVAPYVTIVGLGGGITGALTMNKDTFDSLPPELQEMFRQIGKEYGELVSDRVDALKNKVFQEQLPKLGATIYELPPEEQKKWASQLPNLVQQWADAASAEGLPTKEVLNAWMEGARQRGVEPKRAWDEELK